MTSMLSMLGIIAMIVAGLLVLNVINSIVGEDKRQIGVMKVLGRERLGQLRDVRGYRPDVWAGGGVPGVLLGIPLGYLAAKGMASTMETVVDLQFTISPSAIVLGIVIGLGVPVLAALVPVVNGTRVTILDAMTDLGIDSGYGKGFFPRLIGWLPLPITVRQGLSNVIQKRSRLAFTVLTLSIAAGAFMGIFALFSSVDFVLNDTFNTYDVQILIHPDQPQDFAAVRQLIPDNIDGIDSVASSTSDCKSKSMATSLRRRHGRDRRRVRS